MKRLVLSPPTKPQFQKTEVPSLYRYSPNGVYYALVKHEGKQKRTSLKTTDRATAKRKLVDFQRDLSKADPTQGKMTLHGIAAHYLSVIQSQAAATVSLKKGVVERLLADLPSAQTCRLAK